MKSEKIQQLICLECKEEILFERKLRINVLFYLNNIKSKKNQMKWNQNSKIGIKWLNYLSIDLFSQF